LLIFLTISLVLFAELLNTAVEKMIDLITTEYHPVAKVVKDVTAGAVLLTAGLAVIVGISIFYPYVNSGFRFLLGNPSYPPRIGLAAIIVFNFFLTLLIKGLLHRTKRKQYEPSMIMSTAFCIGALIVAILNHLLISLLVYILIGMLVASSLKVTNRMSIIFGSLLGTLVSMIGVQFL
jgi:hypothetical protein